MLEKDGAIPLSNSLSVAEQPRIERTLRQASQDSKLNADPIPFRHGELDFEVCLLSKIVLEDLGRPQQPPPVCDFLFCCLNAYVFCL